MTPNKETVDLLDTPEAGARVVRGGAVRVAGFAIGTLMALAAIVLLTRYLGVEEFGRFQVVVSLVAVVGVVTDLGMTTVGIREYAQRGSADRDRLMRSILGMRLTVTLVGVVLAAAFALAVGYRWDMVGGVLLMGVGLIVLVFQTTLQIPLNAELRLGAVTALDVGRQTLQAGITAALVVLGAGLLPFFSVTMPVHVVLFAFTAVLAAGAISLSPSFSLREWKLLTRPMLSYSLAVAVGIVYVYTAQILTSLVATDHETGLFSAGFRVFVVLAAIPALLASAAFPLLSRAARDDHDRLANIVRGLFAGTLLLGGAVALVCVVGAGPIIDVIAGPGYEPAADVLRIEGAAMLVTFAIGAWGYTLLALHKHSAMVYANLAAFVVSAVTVVILAPPLGEIGAALGILFGEVVLAGGYIWALARERRDLRPDWKQSVRVALALGAAGTVVFLPLPAVPETALAVAVYFIAAYVTKAVPVDLVAQLPEPLRRRLQP